MPRRKAKAAQIRLPPGPLAAKLTTPLLSRPAMIRSGLLLLLPCLLAALMPLCVQAQALAAASAGPAGNAGFGPRVHVPTLPRVGYSRYPWKTDIIATVFWIGEEPSGNNRTPNHSSSWDKDWASNYGGFDNPDPSQRGNDYCPIAFKPRLNPFYVALPYNDCLNYKTHKAEARFVIPWFGERYQRPGKTVLRGQWLAIRHGNRICYAQWEDCGPFFTDDYHYVFGNARPRNTQNKGAGIDVSPAVRDYLGMSSGRRCDWRFVDATEVPDGPWRQFGENNTFVRARQLQQPTQQAQQAQPSQPLSQGSNRLEQLRRMRDEYFQRFGNSQYMKR